MRRSVIGVLCALVIGSMFGSIPATASTSAKGAPKATDIRHLDRKDAKLVMPSNRIPAGRVNPNYGVGAVKYWLALDDFNGIIYVKQYTLRAMGERTEVWVANNTSFPSGDCRNGVRTTITDEQAQYLADEFDNNMYPIETDLFSAVVPQNGENAVLDDILGLPSGYYKGKGGRIVTLVDNVRDDNYFDTDNTNGFSYIAGFYFSLFDFYHDRRIMSID